MKEKRKKRKKTEGKKEIEINEKGEGGSKEEGKKQKTKRSEGKEERGMERS